MRTISAVLLICGLSSWLTACKKPAPAVAEASPAEPALKAGEFDACALLQPNEVAAIIGSPIKENKGSVRTDEGFSVWQCFSEATDFSKSVTLTVNRGAPPNRRSPRDFWHRKFAASPEEADGKTSGPPSVESEEEEGKKTAPPRRIDRLGDEAFWVGSSGALYVLKGDAFLRIGLGGEGSEESKISRATALAEKALSRF